MKKITTILLLVATAFTMMAQTNTTDGLNDKTYFRFHWGFNNWGEDPFSGFTGISTPGYDIRTSFSSYQLSLGYNFVKTDNIELSIGIGYESDLYKYDKGAYISHVSGHLVSLGNYDGYKSKICTRYATIPVGLGFRTGEKGFGLRVSAIPGLSFSGKNTGLKVKNENDKTVDNLKGELNPYKFDVRLDLDFDGFGVFLQVATMPLMKDSFEKELYPIKFGFVI